MCKFRMWLLYQSEEGYYRESMIVFRTYWLLCIYYTRGLSNAERYVAFMQHMYDINEVIIGNRYDVSDESFDPSASSSFTVDGDREQ